MSGDNRSVVEAYVEASIANDIERLGNLRHEAWIEDWPQSGERLPGHDAYRRIHEEFPGGYPAMAVDRVVGSDDRWVATPALTVQRVLGNGDVWIVEGRNRYGDGSEWHLVKHLELRDGRIWREVTYFAAPFEAPAWRAPFVERIG